MSAKTRQQSATLADPACDDLLVEKMSSLVPAIYSDGEAFVFPRLIAMFHTVQRGAFAAFIDAIVISE